MPKTPPVGTLNPNEMTKLELLSHFKEKPIDDIFGQPEDGLKKIHYTSPMESTSTGSGVLLMLAAGARRKDTRHHRVSRYPSQMAPVRPLDEYLENDSTDITSQINDDDFPELEQIIDDNGGDISMVMAHKLHAKKQALYQQAESDEIHYGKVQRYRTSPKLRTKHSNLTEENLRQNTHVLDKTSRIHDYICNDEDEGLDDGFDEDFDAQLSKSAGIIRPPTRQPMKKYRLTVDMKNPSAGYNFNEGVQSRLSRIPSFYRADPDDQALARQTSKMNLNSRSREKQELLGRFSQAQPARKRQSATRRKPKLFTDVSEFPQAAKVPSTMRFNRDRGVWEGNDVDLARFDRPSLITPQDASDPSLRAPEKHHMVLDTENGRWLSADPNDEECIFSDIPDLTDERHQLWRPPSQYKLAAPPKLILFCRSKLNLMLPMKPKRSSEAPPPAKLVLRKPSSRTISTVSRATSGSSQNNAGNEFYMSDDLLKRFSKEEAKIERKINNWFNVGEVYDFRHVNAHAASTNRGYLWEIRKLVMETD